MSIILPNPPGPTEDRPSARLRRAVRDTPHAELEAAGREEIPDSLLQRIRARSASAIQ